MLHHCLTDLYTREEMLNFKNKLTMKIQKIISIKVVRAAMLVTTLLIIAACGGKQENSAREKRQSSVSQTSPRPPSMDLHTATVLGNIEAIHQHILAGSDLDERDPSVGSSPLITAAVFGKTEVAKALIEAGADVNFKNNEGSTALHTAAFLCRTEIVEILLDKGADKDLRNNAGSTALESVEVPFTNVKFIYDIFSKDLGPLGLKLDYAQIEMTRPKIAEMLQ